MSFADIVVRKCANLKKNIDILTICERIMSWPWIMKEEMIRKEWSSNLKKYWINNNLMELRWCHFWQRWYTNDIQSDVLMKESYFKELLENFANHLVIENDDWWLWWLHLQRNGIKKYFYKFSSIFMLFLHLQSFLF